MITEFISALERHGWPTLQAFTRTFERSDLDQAIEQHCPQLADAPDHTIEQWWKWAGSLDPETLSDIVRYLDGIVVPYCVAPDGAELADLNHLLDMIAQRPNVIRDYETVFPILGSVHNCLYALRRTTIDEPWQIWYLDREDADWRPIQRVFYTPTEAAHYRATDGGHDVQTPTFDQWLTRLVQGLDSGEIEVGERGGIELANRPTDLNDPRYRYPWQHPA